MFFAILVLFLATAYGEKNYDGWVLLKVQPKTPVQLKTLQFIQADVPKDQIQVWQQGTLKRPFDIFLAPEIKNEFIVQVGVLGMNYTMESENIQRVINAEKSASKNRNAGWFNKFLRLDEINSAIDQLVSKYPNIMSVETIGKGWEGRPIRLVTVTSKNGKSKPGIWIDGGIHAREWASPATVLYMLNKLVSSPDNSKLLDSATFYFVVVLNPDGYDYTHKYDRMWRKNRRPARYSGCEGVDLNRNFGYSFGGAGTSDDPCEDIFRGQSAFSEPESQAVRDFVTKHKDIKAFITIHAYSQMWFVPYGDKYDNHPADYNKLKRVADAGAAALAKKYGTHYDVGTAADLLYEAAGGSDDWAKGHANIEYVYCLELRPAGDAPGNGFLLSPRQIVQTGEETWDGLSVVFNAVIGKK